MKYLDMPALGRLTQMLTDCALGDQMLNGRIEAYSCKKAGDDKRLSKALQEKFQRKRKRSRGDSINTSFVSSTSPTSTTSLDNNNNNNNNNPEGSVSVLKPSSSGEVSSSIPTSVSAASLHVRRPSGAAQLATGGPPAEEDNSGQTEGIVNVAPKRPRSSSFIMKQQMARQSSNHSFEQSQSSHMVPPLRTHASDLSVVGSSTQSLNVANDEQTRKVIIDLISTLNAMHDDYDFSESRGEEQFVKHNSINDIIPIVNKNLAEVMELRVEGFLNQLWSEVDKAIQVRQCQVYSYLPADGDPFCGDGVLWSFNYFFYNHDLNRVLCFSCKSDAKWSTAKNGGRPNVFSPSNMMVKTFASPYPSPLPSPTTTPNNQSNNTGNQNNSPWSSQSSSGVGDNRGSPSSDNGSNSNHPYYKGNSSSYRNSHSDNRDREFHVVADDDDDDIDAYDVADRSEDEE
jgi:hypothetical protein